MAVKGAPGQNVKLNYISCKRILDGLIGNESVFVPVMALPEPMLTHHHFDTQEHDQINISMKSFFLN